MIVIVNGTSSSGKSTVSCELHRQLGDGWLNFSTDGYLNMLGDKMLGLHPNNPDVCEPNDICYAKQHDDGTYEVVPGQWCSKLYVTIPDVLGSIAEQGFDIILDSFISTWDEFRPYQETLSKYRILFVYLYAPENILAAREASRGDRLKGSARHWLKRFECQEACHLTFNTDSISIEAISSMILEKITTLKREPF